MISLAGCCSGAPKVANPSRRGDPSFVYAGQAMAITVEDFPSLLRILDEHPEWLEELRRRILHEQFLKLPDWVRQNSRDIQALRDSIETSRVAFEARFTTVDADIATLKTDVAVLKHDVGTLQGDSDERKWKDNFAGRFGHLIRRAKIVSANELEAFEDAVDSGAIDDAEALAVRLLDIIIRGIRGKGSAREETYFAVEVSSTIHEHDVSRAIERAAILRKVGYNAIPVVAGSKMAAPLRDSAVERGVEVVFGD